VVVLEAQNVLKSFGGVNALRGVDVSVQEEHITALIGPNGSGKTTLFNIISGVLPMDSGEILFMGNEVSSLPPHKRATLGIARTFQNLQIFHDMTVMENVMMGGFRLTTSGFIAGGFYSPKVRKEMMTLRKDALDLLESLDLVQYANQKAGDLPFGIQRKVEIARALALKPKLLLLDEPAAGLTTKETLSLAHFIQSLKGRNITVFLVEHDMDLVMGISDWIIVLNFGQKIYEGTPLAVKRERSVIKAYLGDRRAKS
jgi:branched-chain amino acid transport system ATP-binding protein